MLEIHIDGLAGFPERQFIAMHAIIIHLQCGIGTLAGVTLPARQCMSAGQIGIFRADGGGFRIRGAGESGILTGFATSSTDLEKSRRCCR